MSEASLREKLEWGLWWGSRYALAGVVLGAISAVVKEGLDFLLMPHVMVAWLIGIPLACLIGGAIVGLMRPVSVDGGVPGAMLTGSVVYAASRSALYRSSRRSRIPPPSNSEVRSEW